MEIVPYTFRPAKFINCIHRGYWVTLYLLFDGSTTHTFFHQSEYLENGSLCREIGVSVFPFTKEILVTPSQFTEIFKSIEDYVSRTNND